MTTSKTPQTCAALRTDLERLLVEGETKNRDDVLAHVRTCDACRALYDAMAEVADSRVSKMGAPSDDEPTAAFDAFLPDDPENAPPRLLARQALVMPPPLSSTEDEEERAMPFFQRMSSRLLSLALGTAVAVIAVMLPSSNKSDTVQTRGGDAKTVVLKVGCVIPVENGESELFIIDRPYVSGARTSCPKGAELTVASSSMLGGTVVGTVDGTVVFGPAALPSGGTLKGLPGTFRIDGTKPMHSVRVVVVSADLSDDDAKARAADPQPGDAAASRDVPVDGRE